MKKVRWTERRELARTIMQMRANNLGNAEIAEGLNRLGVKTNRGHTWRAQKVSQFLHQCRKAGMKMPRIDLEHTAQSEEKVVPLARPLQSATLTGVNYPEPRGVGKITIPPGVEESLRIQLVERILGTDNSDQVKVGAIKILLDVMKG
jgi:hypothetical protein